jgi:hypothetical protein
VDELAGRRSSPRAGLVLLFAGGNFFQNSHEIPGAAQAEARLESNVERKRRRVRGLVSVSPLSVHAVFLSALVIDALRFIVGFPIGAL